MDIMTALFDQDYVTRMYGVDQRRVEKKETAMKLIQKGMRVDFVSDVTVLSIKEIEALQKMDAAK